MQTARSQRNTSRWLHPTRLVVASFAVVALVGGVLLTLPFASESGESTDFVTALFTAVSALCVTGLVVVDTGTHWSGFGEVVILALIQIGGFGITTAASVFGVLVFRRLGLRTRMLAQTERAGAELGDMRALIRGIGVFYLVVEGVGFVLLTLAYLVLEDASVPDATYFGLFHSVSAFNNAGFSTLPDNLVGLSGNTMILVVVMALIIVGGIGYPVVYDIARTGRNPRHWTLHAKLTLFATVAMLVSGMVLLTALEWGNPDTLGSMPTTERLVNGAFASVTPRTAGFNSIDYGSISQPGLLVTSVLMFVGGGSASTAGGIKVTTFALLGFVIWAELRGEPDVNAFGRRVPTSTQRQALSVALAGVGLAATGTLALAWLSDLVIGPVGFEVLSALGTVGLSTGITSGLPTGGHLLLILLMFLGRLGPVTVGTALVLGQRDRHYRYPEGRPLIG